MRKIKYIILLLFFTSCSESDYRKIDSAFGLFPVQQDSVLVKTEITPDNNDFEPFTEKDYDSGKVAKKMEIVKDNVFKPIPRSKKGKTIAEILAKNDDVGKREDAKFINKRRRLLDSIYQSNSKRAKSITAKPDSGQ